MCYPLYMKKFFTLIFIFFSSNIYGEIIYCTYEFESKGEGFLLERSGDKFNWTTADNDKFTLEVVVSERRMEIPLVGHSGLVMTLVMTVVMTLAHVVLWSLR